MIRVFAVGEVHTPGLNMLPEKSTVLDLLSAAGGPSTNAWPNRATLVRVVGGKTQTYPVDLSDLLSKGDMTQNMTLQDGDVLMLPTQKSPAIDSNAIITAVAILARAL